MNAMAARPGVVESVYQLKVTLREIEPPIWRRLLVPGSISLHRLHQVIQEAMPWQDYHLHEFTVGDVTYGEPDPEYDYDREIKSDRKVKLRDVAARARASFQYTYDFGDNWEHDVLVEAIRPAEEPLRFPICLAGERASPPEDCGGPPGYEHILEVIQNPDDEEYDETIQWLEMQCPGGPYEPDVFDVNRANARLRQVPLRVGRRARA